MQDPHPDWSKRASSVKRRLTEMRKTLGMRKAPDTANENNAPMEKKPTEPKGP